MSTHTAEEIQRHVKIYISVFVALAALTVVTVAVSYLHLSLWPAVCVALLIALIKGSLVACFFMHLISEKQIIFWVLALTALFFFTLLLGPMISRGSHIPSYVT